MNNENRGVHWSTVAMVLICVIVAVVIFAGSWYFWGESGAQVALAVIAFMILFLLVWAIIMATIGRVSYIYRDAAQTLVDFQAADDRGEIARTAVNLIRTGNQLDSRVLATASRLATGQARALIEARQQPAQVDDDDDYWTVPQFEDVDDAR